MLMYIFSTVGFIALVFNMIVILSTNNGEKVTKHLSWGHGICKDIPNNCNDIWVGVWSIFSTSDGGESFTIYSSTECDQGWCDSCSDSMRTVMCFAGITIALVAIGLFTNLSRTNSAGNTFTNQIIGVVTSTISVITGIITVVVFSSGCYNKLQDSDMVKDRVSDQDWFYGPATILMVLVILLKVIDVVGNAIVPVDGNQGSPASRTNEAKHSPVNTVDAVM